MILLKQLLNECFLDIQIEELFKNHPQIYKLIINDPIVKKTGKFGSFDQGEGLKLHNIVSLWSVMGGNCGDYGPDDWYSKKLVSFVKMLSSKDEEAITKETSKEIIKIIESDPKLSSKPSSKQLLKWWNNDYVDYLKIVGKKKADEYLRLNANKNDIPTYEQAEQIIKLNEKIK